MESLGDEQLLQRIARGDSNALALLYDRYGRLAYSLAYRILGDVPSAEDAVQEAFLNIWRMAPSFDGQRGSARTWLLSVARHKAIDALRQRRRQQPLGLVTELSETLTPAEDIWQGVDIALQREALERNLAQIPVEQRQVIEMAYFGGYTHQEIGKQLNIPLGTVKGRIRMGMEKLRSLLKSQEGGR